MLVDPIKYDSSVSGRAMSQAEGFIIKACCQFTVYGYDPEDLAQELRMHLWRKLEMYDPNKSNFSTWSYVVIKNRVRDLNRKKDPLCRKHDNI